MNASSDRSPRAAAPRTSREVRRRSRPLARSGARSRLRAMTTGSDEQPDGLDGEAGDPALPVLVAQPLPAQRFVRSQALGAHERSRSLPVVQAAAVAAGSFVAGAAVAGLM